MSKSQKFTHPLRWYAENYQVSIATVKRWSARGYDLDDPNTIQWELIGQKHEPPDFNPIGGARKHDMAEEAAKSFTENRDAILKIIPLIASGKNVEGCTRKQTVTGHVRLINLMLETLWRESVLILLQGISRKEAKERVRKGMEEGE